ncbi:MAG: hypothetical protein IT530_11270 [Burkholderiales bacterium]|nr:hypothetical protein [Burkholderiales bacterium]
MSETDRGNVVATFEKNSREEVRVSVDEFRGRKIIGADKDANQFLQGVPAVLKALRSRQIECRVYDKEKFHAKAYITHEKLEVVGSQALVGSSNFTKPGLTMNVELNIQVQSAREVAQLQEWFDAYWDEATDVTDTVNDTVERQVRLDTPVRGLCKGTA